MNRDTAHRSFFLLAAVALVPYLLVGLFGCGLLSVVAYRLATDGLSGLDERGQDLRLASIFFAIVAAGTVVAAVSIRRQLAATRRLTDSVRASTVPVAPNVQLAAARAELTGRVDVVQDARPFSFAYGMAPTRVAISTGMVQVASPQELIAVLSHERYHVRSNDPFKVVVARAAAAAFFPFPAVRHLRDRYLASRELAADRRAVHSVGVGPLAGALTKVVDSPAWVNAAGMAALGGSSFLDVRVAQLELGHEPPLEPVPRRAMWGTGVGVVFVVAVAIVAALMGGGASADASSLPSSGPVGALFKITGALTCMCVWVVAAVVIRRRAIGHQRLTSDTRTTTHT